jgi:cellulose synthase/poly-beta-1,6-N-acetylglucosamine synthase-like glycosyltransferase
MASGRVPKTTMTRLTLEEPGLVLAVTLIVLFSLSYTFAVFVVSRRKRVPELKSPDGLYFVFVVPCLNEELVIGRTIENLLEIPAENFSVLVVDDGSDDSTADIAEGFHSDRVWVLRRTAPEARLGKGKALNAAFRHLMDSNLLGGWAPQDVVVVIVDADGRISRNALHDAGTYFMDPKVGAVQVGVRMNNRKDKLLARLQDMEFVTFTEIFQRGREHVGSVGLGGNGQFTRLSALASLAPDPWTDCLTEDLDLGVRLLCIGWHTEFSSRAYVSQQAVTKFRRLVRQRARWFQGHMQCWRRIPNVLGSEHLPGRSAFDLVYHLMSPALVLLMTLPMLAFTMVLVGMFLSAPSETANMLLQGAGENLAIWYLLSFGAAPFYGFAYWVRSGDSGLVKSLLLAHLYTLYSYFWFIAGWVAVWNVARRKNSWAKTARNPEGKSSVSAGQAAN